jgi:hypothetical protein
VSDVEKSADEAGRSSHLMAVQIGTSKMDNRTKIVVAVIGLLSLLITAYVAHRFGVSVKP